MRLRPAWLTLVIIGFFLAFTPRTARAGDWYLVPRLDLGARYDNNINFSFNPIRSDFIFNVSPSVDVDYTSEVTKLTASLALKGLAYVKNPNLDTINQYYRVSGKHKVAPRLGVTFTGGYTLDSTLRQELLESGFVMNRTRRQAFDAAPGFEFNLTERALLRGNYAFNRVNYQDPKYNDFSTHRVNLGLNYLLKNAKTTISATILGRYTEYPSISNFYRNIGTYAGLEHKFSEDWSLALSAGTNFNWFSSQTAVLDFAFFPDFVQVRQATEKTFTVSPFLNVAATRRWPKANLNFGYRIDQRPSGAGAIYQSQRGYAGFTHDFTERLQGGLRGSLYYSRATSPGSSYENLIFYLVPELRYRLTKRISLNSSYRFGWRHDLLRNRSIDRQVVWLSLSYSHPLDYKK
ncbi:MAG: outer membrane beta-barrel protein [Syntrophobacterales bacterium]